MVFDHLMEVLGLRSFTSLWLDNCACCLVVFSHVLAFVDRLLVAYLMVMEHAILLWCGCHIYTFILNVLHLVFG